MTAQELANTLVPLLERVSVPLTKGNIDAASAMYETLGMMARGELILAPRATIVPEGTGNAK